MLEIKVGEETFYLNRSLIPPRVLSLFEELRENSDEPIVINRDPILFQVLLNYICGYPATRSFLDGIMAKSQLSKEDFYRLLFADLCYYDIDELTEEVVALIYKDDRQYVDADMEKYLDQQELQRNKADDLQYIGETIRDIKMCHASELTVENLELLDEAERLTKKYTANQLQTYRQKVQHLSISFSVYSAFRLFLKGAFSQAFGANLASTAERCFSLEVVQKFGLWASPFYRRFAMPEWMRLAIRNYFAQ